MSFELGTLPPGWNLLALLPMVPAWILAVRALPVARFARDDVQCHAFWGSCVALALLWSIKASLPQHLTLHLLGVTAVTLAFGVPGAIVAATVSLAALAAVGALPWETIAANALTMGVVPALATAAWLRAVRRWLPANFLVHVFVTAFVGGALAMSLATLAGASAVAIAGTERWSTVLGQLRLTVVPLSYAEAMLSALLVTLLVVYRPEWVSTLEDLR